MAAQNDLLDQLAAVPLFVDCTKKELAQIARLTTSLFIDEGVEFITEGGFAREMMVVVSGTAVVTRGSQVIAELGPGTVVGELALLTGLPRNATVTAQSKLEILVLNSAAFSTLLDDVPSVTRHILTTVARRLTEAEHAKV
jgi:CRP-like cAMP-binding protein